MKKTLFFTAATVVLATNCVAAMAQSAIYRCGNEYLNDAILAASRGCKVVEGGNVTLVTGTRVNPLQKEASGSAAAGSAVASAPDRSLRRSPADSGVNAANTRPSVDAATQRSRDSDARSILLAELKTVEGRLAEQLQAYRNVGADTRGPELQDAVNRYTADIAGLKREIARLPTTVSSSGQ